MRLLDKFHCPACRGPLAQGNGEYLVCHACNETVPVRDGIVDFVCGRFDTILDAEHYDETHRVDDSRVDSNYAEMKRFAGDRWPLSLGSVLEVGCGTGLFSRALIGHGDARDAVLTDVSVGMLAGCREQFARRNLMGRVPVTFATYSSQENCFRDAVFDTCAGTSVLHHIPDVRGFLAEVFRSLRPGGRAFFMEPNLRFHRALMHTLADVLAQLQARDEEFSIDRQKLMNILAEGRRMMLHQGDLGFLSALEDKHMFVAEEFEQMGLELGFASAAALPCGSHATGVGIIASLCGQLGIGDVQRRAVMELLPAYSTRYLAHLCPRDRSSGFLLWLEKGVGPSQRVFHGPPSDSEKQYLAEQPPDPTGGLPVRCSLSLHARQTESGIALHLTGWCLMNADILWLQVTLGETTRQAPVWRPRPDVQQAINGAGLYPAWNAFCSGIDADLAFEGIPASSEGLALRVEIVLIRGAVLRLQAPERLQMDQEVRIPG